MSARVALAVVLGLALAASAVGAVLVQHQRRALFAELARLERQRDALEAQWGRLQLEQGTWGRHERIDTLARERLRLVVPGPAQIIVVER